MQPHAMQPQGFHTAAMTKRADLVMTDLGNKIFNLSRAMDRANVKVKAAMNQLTIAKKELAKLIKTEVATFKVLSKLLRTMYSH